MQKAWRQRERRLDTRAAMICCAIANARPGNRKHWRVDDFIGKDPDARVSRGRPKSTQDLWEAFLGIAKDAQDREDKTKE